MVGWLEYRIGKDTEESLRSDPVICLERLTKTTNFLSRLGSLWARDLPNTTMKWCAPDRDIWPCFGLRFIAS
jgi:hypothetical protein